MDASLYKAALAYAEIQIRQAHSEATKLFYSIAVLGLRAEEHGKGDINWVVDTLQPINLSSEQLLKAYVVGLFTRAHTEVDDDVDVLDPQKDVVNIGIQYLLAAAEVLFPDKMETFRYMEEAINSGLI